MSQAVVDPPRSLDQNAALWPALHDIAAQVGYRPARWRGDRCVQEGGYAPIGPGIRTLTPEDWKDVLTALWKTTSGVRIRYVPHPDGNGLIALGLRTSKLSKRAMSDFLECVFAFGAMHGVRFTAPHRWTA